MFKTSSNGKTDTKRVPQILKVIKTGWAYIREDNSRALASGLSPIHTHNHTITFIHVHFVHCEIFDVKHLNITQRYNKTLNDR